MKSKGGGGSKTQLHERKIIERSVMQKFFYIFHKLLKKNHLNKSHDFLATCSLITPGPDLLQRDILTVMYHM